MNVENDVMKKRINVLLIIIISKEKKEKEREDGPQILFPINKENLLPKKGKRKRKGREENEKEKKKNDENL